MLGSLTLNLPLPIGGAIMSNLKMNVMIFTCLKGSLQPLEHD